MPRIARVIAEGFPHHITQRGNAKQVIFRDSRDHFVYLKLLRRYAEEYSLRVSAWCLMDNHIHLLATPETTRSLARTLGQTHSDYARYCNTRDASCGHIWQSRYYSCPVDAHGVWQVMAYIERNPVRAGLVDTAELYPWSSARAHVIGQDHSGFLDMTAWTEFYSARRWRELLRMGVQEEALQERIRDATRSGRPFGSMEFLAEIERASDRQLRSRHAGRPKKIGPREEASQLEIGI